MLIVYCPGMRRLLLSKLRAFLARYGLKIEWVPPTLLRDPSSVLALGFDEVLAHYLLERGDPSGVYFIQIGAFDGQSGDPLHRYVCRFGWRGILVEPQERYFRWLQRTYEGFDGLRLVRAAVAEEPGEKVLYTIGDLDAPDLPEWAPQVASFQLEAVLRHRPAIRDLEARLVREVVPCVPLAQIFEQAESEIELVQIDTEGYDYQVLRQIDFGRFSPAIVRYEHKHLSLADQDAAVALLVRHGYRIAREANDTTAYRGS